MADLTIALRNDRALRAQLLAQFPELSEDEEALIDTLDGISDFDEQIAAAMRAVLEREAMAKGLADLIAKMGERKTRLVDGAERIRTAVLNMMLAAHRSKITKPDMTISIHPGRPSVQIIEEWLLPDDLVVVTRRPDMKAINEAVKAGRNVPGTAPKNTKPYLTARVS